MMVRTSKITRCDGLGTIYPHRTRFIPMQSTDAFGFVDPADVLRCCHLMPAFADGRPHPDRISTSQLAGDADDWKYYYINRYGCLYSFVFRTPTQLMVTRFVDRDMLMRYHWGLGIGHSYTHTKRPSEVNPYSHSIARHDVRPLLYLKNC